MKQYKYFKTVQDVIDYYGSVDNVPSKVIAVVGENEALFTSSNNFIEEAVPVVQGGYVESPEEKAEYAYATSLSSYTLVGNSPSTIEIQN